ncbi:hypothetical protein [Actinokineospora cianjurensis]|uniref:Uncharacterized protein n=1 Tax=Actinokineospora cianjurensis TaxID=585224 RepID=A0A421B8B0_9PSEU|nr:hypothetical protein [Actinokineospora cianjurensis]RLK60495.1 hypothetical protein CLV68_1000 [Actinokineospora cianjurensis]
MSAPPFALLYTREVEQVLEDLRAKQQYAAKLKKVRKALRLLEQVGPGHPGLHSHRYQSVPGPGGAALWESYVENKTPSAWRVWWIHGPRDDQLTIVTIGPHP